jgi:hypothetical protein
MGLQVEAISPAPSKITGTAALPLAYQRNAPIKPSARGGGGDNNIGEPFKDLYLPIILFVSGFVLTIVEARFALRITGLGFILGYAGVVTLINLVLVFAGIMFATKLLDLGLGPIGPALMKIAAIAVLPGAVASLIGSMIHTGGDYVGWLASLLLTYGMFMGLLGLDFTETILCSVIIWLVRTWIGFMLTIAILKGFGLFIGTQIPSSPPRKSTQPPPRQVQNTKQLESDAAAALASPTAMEAKAWLAAGAEGHPHVIRLTDERSPLETVEKLYSLGATSIAVTRVDIGAQRDSADQFVITLPADKSARQKIFTWYRLLSEAYDLIEIKDEGQKNLMVDYSKNRPIDLRTDDPDTPDE